MDKFLPSVNLNKPKYNCNAYMLTYSQDSMKLPVNEENSGNGVSPGRAGILVAKRRDKGESRNSS
jgi:hypothetical protein